LTAHRDDLLTHRDAATAMQPYLDFDASEWLADSRRTEPRYRLRIPAPRSQQATPRSKPHYRRGDIEDTISVLASSPLASHGKTVGRLPRKAASWSKRPVALATVEAGEAGIKLTFGSRMLTLSDDDTKKLCFDMIDALKAARVTAASTRSPT
jgi:hypothetical protein